MMRDLIDRIVKGDDKSFEPLMKALIGGSVLAFAQESEDEEAAFSFLHYLLENEKDVEYIPLFTDEDEAVTFIGEADIPEGYGLFEFDGIDLATAMHAEQYLMINPVTGGIVFQGAHLKIFSDPANDDTPGG